MTGRYLTTKELMLSLEPFHNPSTSDVTSSSLSDPTDYHHYCLDDSHDELLTKKKRLDFYDLIGHNALEAMRYAEHTEEGKRDALIITDRKGAIVHINQSWTDLCGFTLEQVKVNTQYMYSKYTNTFTNIIVYVGQNLQIPTGSADLA